MSFFFLPPKDLSLHTAHSSMETYTGRPNIESQRARVTLDTAHSVGPKPISRTPPSLALVVILLMPNSVMVSKSRVALPVV